MIIMTAAEVLLLPSSNTWSINIDRVKVAAVFSQFLLLAVVFTANSKLLSFMSEPVENDLLSSLTSFELIIFIRICTYEYINVSKNL